MPFQPEGLPDAALDGVSPRSKPRMFASDQHAEPRFAGFTPLDEESISVDASPHAAAQQTLKLRAIAETKLRAQTVASGRG